MLLLLSRLPRLQVSRDSPVSTCCQGYKCSFPWILMNPVLMLVWRMLYVGNQLPGLAPQNNPTVLFMRNIGKNLALGNCCSSCRDNYYNFSFVRKLLRCSRLKPELKNYRGLFTVLRASLYLGRD